MDADCSTCALSGPLGGMQATACFEQACAKCSATTACPAGTLCQKGDCVKPCGTASNGACSTTADCAGCGSGGAPSPWVCSQNVCKVGVTGCSDLGSNPILPAPWNQSTALCSNDADCTGLSVPFNFGALIRDVLGSPELDIGIKKVKIQDASVPYALRACSVVALSNGVSCGVCTPCHADADCQPIPLSTAVFDLFKGDPLAQISGAFLLDLLYGASPNPSLHFQCLEVAPGLGSCTPCPDPTHAC